MGLRVLVTGRGSIARRHVEHLRALAPGAEIAVVAAGPVDAAFQPCELMPDFAAGLQWRPDAVVIASVSSRHADELVACLAQRLPCLLEKPAALSRGDLARIRQATAAQQGIAVQVGCNLRQLAALQQLRSLLAAGTLGRVVRSHLEVGQDLRQWRPGRELSSSYSADRERGGGVVFDLVHEIDMALWLLGPLRLKAAAGGHLSGLPIAADDVHTALLVDAHAAPVVIALDYVSRRPVRRYVFVAEEGTIEFDLMARELRVADASGVRCITREPADFDVAATYRAQLADWLAAVRDPARTLASPLADAIRATELMLAMQEAC
jgi:predicted dehydrogenase